MNTFTMDKSVEKAWDEYVQKFFASQELDFEYGIVLIYDYKNSFHSLSMEGVFLTSWLQFHLFNTLERFYHINLLQFKIHNSIYDQ